MLYIREDAWGDTISFFGAKLHYLSPVGLLTMILLILFQIKKLMRLLLRYHTYRGRCLGIDFGVHNWEMNSSYFPVTFLFFFCNSHQILTHHPTALDVIIPKHMKIQAYNDSSMHLESRRISTYKPSFIPIHGFRPARVWLLCLQYFTHEFEVRSWPHILHNFQVQPKVCGIRNCLCGRKRLVSMTT